MDCVVTWEQKHRGKHFTCPTCRAECDGLAAHPQRRAQQKKPETERLRIEEEDFPIGHVDFVVPTSIHFTHSSIKSEFNPFSKLLQDGTRVHVKNLHILDSAAELQKGDIPPELDILEVVWHDDRLYVAGTNNRRLCMWRLLHIFYPERFGMVKVKVWNGQRKPLSI